MPRSAPEKVVEHRITLGTYERARLEQAANTARNAAIVASVGRIVPSIALASVGAALGLGLIGFGLDSDLDRERIRDVLIGTPNVRRTRRDGTEQVVENIFFGVPILGPLFGTGMRIGEKTAEAVSNTANAVDEALTSVMGSVSSEYQDEILRRKAAEGRADQAGRSTAGGGPIGAREPPRDPSAADPANRWTSASAGGWS